MKKNIDKLVLGCTHYAFLIKRIKKIVGDKIHYANDPYEAVINADALLIATEWSVFRTPEFNTLASKMKSKVIFDGRNLYDPIKLNELGFYYSSIGRKNN